MENRLIKILLLVGFIPAVLFGCSLSNDTEPQGNSDSVITSTKENSEEGSEVSFNESSDTSYESLDVSLEESIDEISENISSEDEILPDDSDLVLIKDYIPNIKFDIRYATANNFTGQIIYTSDDTYLRYGTVKKLANVQKELESMGLGLLIWDAYRPIEAQQALWNICPDPNFVSDPKNAYSGHCRGIAIDLTIIDSNGNLLTMPSDFDEFSELADREYSDVSKEAEENSVLLEQLMIKHGFSGYRKEWWHYSDTIKYPVVGLEE